MTKARQITITDVPFIGEKFSTNAKTLDDMITLMRERGICKYGGGRNRHITGSLCVLDAHDIVTGRWRCRNLFGPKWLDKAIIRSAQDMGHTDMTIKRASYIFDSVIVHQGEQAAFELVEGARKYV